MSPSGAWRRLRRPSSPLDATPAPRGAGRWLRRALVAILAAVPLLVALPFEAAAQTTPTANTDGSYTVPGGWALLPSGLAPGAKFRLLFITDNWHNASDTSISRYDTHVQYWANLGHSAIVPYKAQFKAIGSTATVDARDHVGATGAGVPIYWLNGARVADSYTDFWDGSWAANAGSDRRNRLGQANNSGTQSDWPWTGTKANGTKSAHPLGSPTPTRGAFGSDNPIEQHAGAPNTQTHAFYALSPVFLVEQVPRVSIVPDTGATEGHTARFTISAHPVPASDLTVNLRVEDAPHADFVAAANEGRKTVTFSGGVAQYNVPVVDDDVDELSGPITVTVLSGDGYTVNTAVSSAQVIASDNDPTTVTLATPYPVALEGSSSNRASIAVTLSRGLVSGESLSVPLDFAGGTRGTDFTLALPGPAPAGVTLAGATVTFTGPSSGVSAAAATVLLSASPDTDILDETVTVSLGTVTGSGLEGALGTHRRTGNGRIALLDDNQAQCEGCPTVSFGSGAVTVREDVGIMSVPVRLSSPRDRTTDVGITVNAGTASSADYSTVDSQVIFDRGDTRAVLQFLIEDDSRNETPETFTATIRSAPGGVGFGTHRTVQVTIEDNDGTAVRLSRSSYGAREGDGVSVTVRVSPRRSVATQVGLAYTNGSAGGGDYTAGPASVTIPANASSHTFTVQTTEDSADENNETFRIALATLPAGVDRGRPSSATVTITDDDLPAVSLVLNDAGLADDIPEGASASFLLGLRRSLQRFEKMTVGLALGGTATRGADYTLRCRAVAGITCRNLASGNPSFIVDGARFTARRVVFLEVDVTEDGTAESRETLSLSMGGDTQTFGIVDAPAASVISFTQNAFTVPEFGSVAQPPLTITPPAGRDITLHFTIAGTATEGRNGDFYFEGDSVLAAGYKRDDFNLRIVNDGRVEEDETIVLTLDASKLPAGVTVGAIPTATVTIRDDESRDHVVTVEAVSDEIDEGETARFRLRSTRPAPQNGTAIRLKFSGSGVGTTQWLSYTVPPGSTVTPLRWPTVDNHTLDRTPREVTVTLVDDPRRPYRVGDPGTATVAMRDIHREVLRVGWESGLTKWSEAAGTIEREIYTNRTLAADLTLHYTLGGTATGGVDYTIAGADYESGTGTFTLPAGTKRWTLVPFPITFVDDSVADNGETIEVTLQPGPGQGLLGGSTVTLTLIENTAATFSVTGNPWVGETLTVTRETSDPDGDGAFSYGWLGRDNSNSHWTVIPGASSSTYTLVDADVGRYIRVQVGYSDGVGFLHVIRWTTAAPIESPRTELTITGGSAVTEGTAATFTVTASPAPASDDTLIVNIGVADAPGADFLASSLEGNNGFWEFAGGVASRTFTLATVADETDEPSGPVTVTLRPRAGHYTVGDPASATVTVNDDDASAPTVSFGGASYSTAEGAAASVTVRISPTRSSPTAVGLTYANGTATSGDYTAAPASVTIPANAASHTFTVQTTEDPTVETDETFTLTIGTLPAGVATGSPSSTTVTITDDDTAPTPTVRFGSTTYSTAEGDAASVTVRISPTRSASTAVGLTYTGVDAEAGDDYTAAPASVTIPANTASHTFTIATTDDSADESDETFTLAIGTLPAGVATGSPSSTTVTIADDDDPPPVPVVTITRDASPVTEGTAAAFTVSASVAPVSALDVTVEVAEGSGGDFVASGDEGTQTVTIGAGETSTTLSVPTQGDGADEPGAEVTATVADGSGYTVGTEASATVAVADGDPTAVTLTGTTSAIAEDGGTKTLTLTLNRALVAGERLDLPVTVAGSTATYPADYRFGCGGEIECRYLGSPGGGVSFVGGPDATRTATLVVTAVDDADDEGTHETVTVGLGTPGGNLDGGATASGSVGFNITDDDDPPPVVTIAGGAAVTEGGGAVFTLTADRAPSANLAVKVEVEDAPGSDFVAAGDEGAQTVTLGAGLTSTTYTVATVNDTVDEPDGPVRVVLRAGARYRLGTTSVATVEVADDDATVGPTLSIDDATAAEGEGTRSPFNPTLTYMPFNVRLSAPQPHTVRVTATSRDSTPVSARVGQDYRLARVFAEFRPGETVTQVWVQIVDDSHDEDPETFELVLSDARGAAIADAVAVGTITNDDPMPAAWLARFGRTVAEQALDGIAGRLAAPRTPGMQGTLAGLTLGGGAPSGAGAGTWSGAGPGLAPGGDGIGVAGPGGFASSPGRLGTGGLGSTPGGFGTGGFGHDPAGVDSGFGHDTAGFGEPQSQTLTMRDALLGSRFTLTGAADASGGSLAFWARAAHGSFDGAEGTFSLDGEATTALLGADYARDRWLVGLALAQSEGEGDYRDTKTAPRPASQDCPGGAQDVLCGGAVREGDGTVDASLTAALPYASLEASQRLKLWGALGYGAGEVTLKTALGGRYRADTTWRMAAAGLRGDLLEAPAEGSGPALALTSDALWARTSSEKTLDLAASASDVTRLRLGLEGSWRIALDGGDAGAAPGASLVPRLEVGARHDGGDAETGFGAELGGGLAWVHPALGLTLDVSGRTLIAHEDDDLEDRGFAAALGFDPRPQSERGPSFSLRQDFGGSAQGGLDALFQSAPLDERSGGEATSRWTAEAAWGLPAFGGRYTASPHAGLGLSPDARDYTLGWRWTPAENAYPLSFGLEATRRESDGAAPEHALGFEASARW